MKNLIKRTGMTLIINGLFLVPVFADELPLPQIMDKAILSSPKIVAVVRATQEGEGKGVVCTNPSRDDLYVEADYATKEVSFTAESMCSKDGNSYLKLKIMGHFEGGWDLQDLRLDKVEYWNRAL